MLVGRRNPVSKRLAQDWTFAQFSSFSCLGNSSSAVINLSKGGFSFGSAAAGDPSGVKNCADAMLLAASEVKSCGAAGLPVSEFAPLDTGLPASPRLILADGLKGRGVYRLVGSNPQTSRRLE